MVTGKFFRGLDEGRENGGREGGMFDREAG